MNKGFLYLLLAATIFTSCKKNEELAIVSVTDVYPLQAGKVFYYRMDSTMVSLDRAQLVKKYYNIKDSIESQFLDNSGRKTFRILRYIRDTSTLLSNNSNWLPYSTNYATYDDNRVEYVDNNLRFVTLVNPVRNGIQWKGNQYINTSTSTAFGFYDGWNYEYQNADESFTVKKGTIQDTYTILHIDETSPDIPFDPTNFQSRTFSKEVYAKGIGLIYKEILHWIYQPSTKYDTDAFGIKLSLIDYK